MRIQFPVLSRVALFLVVGLVAALGTSSHASAHASYDHSSPSDKQVLATSPSQLTISFVENIAPEPGTFATVSNGDTDATAGPSTVSPTDSKTLVVPLQPNLPSGKYDVFWKSTSADDGGVTFGHFSFFVGNPAPSDVAAAAAGVAVAVPDDATDRALTNVSTGSDEGSSGGTDQGASTGNSCAPGDSWCAYCTAHAGAPNCAAPKSGS